MWWTCIFTWFEINKSNILIFFRCDKTGVERAMQRHLSSGLDYVGWCHFARCGRVGGLKGLLGNKRNRFFFFSLPWTNFFCQWLNDVGGQQLTSIYHFHISTNFRVLGVVWWRINDEEKFLSFQICLYLTAENLPFWIEVIFICL